MAPENSDWLEELAEVEEYVFDSDAPIVGPLIARFRQAWNNVATRWTVRALRQQQNEFNRLVLGRLREQDARLIQQDREQTELVHDLAELTAQMARANRLLSSIEARLARLESALDERQDEGDGGPA
ncbi:MAG TPA: hypothetical protein VK879_07760 [Candidatus Sulfomarinibacteraceae bacterium]|nr:hypothetical protein [Candidatus Sulfomarinibacteraceae bacterium]